MPGDFIREPQVTFEDFDAFRDERPKEEKWELIDGVPMVMPPPTLIHQRICRNIDYALAEVLRHSKPEWITDREIGPKLPTDRKFNPEPDVTVIDREIGLDQIYAERFYFVAEVLSGGNRMDLREGSDRPQALAVKLAWYKRHTHCRAVLFVEQGRIAADLHVRGKRWRRLELRDPAARIVIPDIGDVAALADLYRDTPLSPARA